MDNDTDITITPENDPWALEQADPFVIPYDTAFVLFVTLGITTLLSCLVASIRHQKRQDSACPRTCSYWSSCLCITLFFGMLAAGFLLLGAYAEKCRWDDEYNRFGQVRIVDTRVVSDNTTFFDAQSSGGNVFNEGFVAQARVVFGGEWACGSGRNETFCDVYSVITECSRRVCNEQVGECTEGQRIDAFASATTCLVNITGDYEMPIDNSTLDPSIPPQLSETYPEFPMIGT